MSRIGKKTFSLADSLLNGTAVAVVLGVALALSPVGQVEVVRPAEANTPPPSASPLAARPPAISVVEADRREIAESVMVTGSLIPREEVVVGVDIEGLRIIDLLVDQGDRVTAGQVIARLADDTIRTQIAQSESNIARAEAAIAQAKSNIANAQSAEVEAGLALERATPLRDKGIISQEVFETRTAAARGTKARLEAARAALEVATADRGVLLAARHEIELRLAKTEVKAPTDGVVLSRSARLGAVPSSMSDPLFRIARGGRIELDAEVTEATLQKIRVGQRVEVTPAGADKAVAGEVRLVSPQVETATRLGKVRVALPTESVSVMRSGSFARGRIELARREGVTVPRSAVMVERGQASLQVVKDGKVETRKVETGLSGDGRVEIVKGLAAGEQVVFKAGTFVRNGDAVTPVPARPEEVEG
ncbi:efflux RND transporter periplasmic adaptor subunit [Prosthecomicrobium sp. N25]|uniref:efflux RND transporter periplasmic adaptor subunit n=1 Tax=Prosthecomicrobium sp. N25 TaxID=3129254 RepID=UPI0030788F98